MRWIQKTHIFLCIRLDTMLASMRIVGKQTYKVSENFNQLVEMLSFISGTTHFSAWETLSKS